MGDIRVPTSRGYWNQTEMDVGKIPVMGGPGFFFLIYYFLNRLFTYSTFFFAFCHKYFCFVTQWSHKYIYLNQFTYIRIYYTSCKIYEIKG